MSVSQYTNNFMRALPATLRPNPYNIDELVMEAVEKGWETDALAKSCYINERQPNPAFVVTNLRNLCKYPPNSKQLEQVGLTGIFHAATFITARIVNSVAAYRDK